jgi:hypothetical protein
VFFNWYSDHHFTTFEALISMQAAVSDRISGSLIHFSRGGATSARLDLTELCHEITVYYIAEHVAQISAEIYLA